VRHRNWLDFFEPCLSPNIETGEFSFRNARETTSLGLDGSEQLSLPFRPIKYVVFHAASPTSSNERPSVEMRGICGASLGMRSSVMLERIRGSLVISMLISPGFHQPRYLYGYDTMMSTHAVSYSLDAKCTQA
jgi:hypothetical protein